MALSSQIVHDELASNPGPFVVVLRDPRGADFRYFGPFTEAAEAMAAAGEFEAELGPHALLDAHVMPLFAP